MSTPSASLVLVAAANPFVGLELGGPNADNPVLACMLRQVRALADSSGDGAVSGQSGGCAPADPPWDAAFAYHVGFWSHYSDRYRLSTWPLPPVATASGLAAFAERHRMMVDEPGPGDLFLLWNPPRKVFVRTGIVVSVAERTEPSLAEASFECIVIEGNTSPDRALGGSLVLRHRRRFAPKRGDRFIRWAPHRAQVSVVSDKAA